MMSIVESAEVLRGYLDESAACVPPKVYGAISTAVVVMDAVGKAIDTAQYVMADSLQAVCVEVQGGR